MPTTIVILIGLKSNARLEGIPLTGWREYWFADTSALTINRVTKFLELGSVETITKVISDTPLWNLKDQKEIDGFKFQVVDGYSVEVELFSGGKSKCLRYSNPDAYEQVENLQFRAALHKLLADLELSSDEFVYGSNELDGAELPTSQKNQAKQGVAPQSSPDSASDSEGGSNPQPESETRSR
ncbi:hypothetical protein JIN85_17600 [Luteolibacter pohnpeiensis]|uniref:Uncharacterized protein n=1 Tax=Luteolibacter pohnpeiensis TaxID=454153 RepID=A0A934VY68_9BACT|nr:hypothetical protein [Luteolibacter pohnpeiensis]MBK1884239.1 hypothetical protein [Luteolibacter pohnpeiensis]